MNKPIPIELTEFAPDLDEKGVVGLVVRTGNAYPSAKGFESAASFTANGTNIITGPRGAASFRADDGSIFTVAGTTTALFKDESATSVWTDVTRLSGAYSLSGSDGWWEFAKFGNGVYAVGSSATADPVQSYNLSSSTDFADVAGAPSARHITVVRDFVVVGDTTDTTDGRKPSRVRWSGFQQPASWTVSAVTQADYQDLDTLNPNIGPVQSIKGGEYGMAFCEGGIYRMQYVGSPSVFQFDDISPGLGTEAPNSVAQVGDRFFYWSTEGFREISSAGQQRPIGVERVDKYVRGELDRTKIDEFVGIADPQSSRIWFNFPADAADRISLVYDYALDKWAEAATGSAGLSWLQFLSPTTGRTLAYIQSGVGSALQTLTGSDGSLTVDTGVFRLSDNMITVHRVRALGKRIGSTETMEIRSGTQYAFGSDGFTAASPEDLATTVGATSVSDSFPIRITGRDFKFLVYNFSTLNGFEISEYTIRSGR